jgi:hypothetical protein
LFRSWTKLAASDRLSARRRRSFLPTAQPDTESAPRDREGYGDTNQRAESRGQTAKHSFHLRADDVTAAIDKRIDEGLGFVFVLTWHDGK